MITVCFKYRIVIIVCKLVCDSWTVSLDAKVPHQTWLLDSCAFLFWESLCFFMLPKNMNIFNANNPEYIFNLKLWFRLCQCEWNSIPENPHNRSESKTEYLMSLMSWKIKIDSSEASKWIYVLQVPWNIIPVLGSIVLVAPQSCSRCLDIGWVGLGLVSGIGLYVHSGLAPDTLGLQTFIISDVYFDNHVDTVIYINLWRELKSKFILMKWVKPCIEGMPNFVSVFCSVSFCIHFLPSHFLLPSQYLVAQEACKYFITSKPRPFWCPKSIGGV